MSRDINNKRCSATDRSAALTPLYIAVHAANGSRRWLPEMSPLVRLANPFHAAVGVSCVSTLGAGKYWVIDGPGPAAESRALIIHERLLDFGARVHDEGTILHDRLTDGPSL